MVVVVWWKERFARGDKNPPPLKKTPFIDDFKSLGGAPNDESLLFTNATAKTSAKLAQLSEAGLPIFSLCTDPYTLVATTAS